MKTRHSLLLCTLVAGVAACNKPASQAPQPEQAAAGSAVVKIGTANPLTGPFAHWGATPTTASSWQCRRPTPRS